MVHGFLLETRRIGKMVAYKIKIYGKVQKVGFRKFLFAHSFDLNIKGYVKNEEDGSVFVYAMSDTEENLQSFITLCKKGPDRAEVKFVEVEKAEVKDFERFEVL